MSGIGTRAIVEINQTASQFESSIVLCMEDRYIDVKSILGLTLTLMRDREYQLDIHGPDQAAAAAAMTDVFTRHGLQVSLR